MVFPFDQLQAVLGELKSIFHSHIIPLYLTWIAYIPCKICLGKDYPRCADEAKGVKTGQESI